MLRLLEALESSKHLHQVLYLDESVLTSSLDMEWWRRWHPEPMVAEIVEGNNSEHLFPLLPPLGSEGFQDFEEGVKGSKDIIHRL